MQKMTLQLLPEVQGHADYSEDRDVSKRGCAITLENFDTFVWPTAIYRVLVNLTTYKIQ